MRNTKLDRVIQIHPNYVCSQPSVQLVDCRGWNATNYYSNIDQSVSFFDNIASGINNSDISFTCIVDSSVYDTWLNLKSRFKPFSVYNSDRIVISTLAD
jgi:hypothetical protein